MEMMAPMEPYVNWKYVWDISDFNMFFALDDNYGNRKAYECGQNTYFSMIKFSAQLLMAANYEGNLTKSRRFRSVANHITNGVKLSNVYSDVLCQSLSM